MWRVLDPDPEWVDANSGASAPAPPEALWNAKQLLDARSLLESSEEPREWLKARGIGKMSRKKYELGYARRRGRMAIVIPVKEKGRVVNVRFRFFPDVPDQGKYDSLAGRGSHLFPTLLGPGDPKREKWPLVLCAGEFDAIAARVQGVCAVTSTSGASIAKSLLRRFEGERVAVVFDVGEEEQADSVARLLESAGATIARPVYLRDLAPMKDKEDLTDFFVKYGRTGQELKEAARDAVDGKFVPSTRIAIPDWSKPTTAKRRRMQRRGGGPWTPPQA